MFWKGEPFLPEMCSVSGGGAGGVGGGKHQLPGCDRDLAFRSQPSILRKPTALPRRNSKDSIKYIYIFMYLCYDPYTF